MKDESTETKKTAEVKSEIFVQYREYETNMDRIEARIKEDYFRKEVAPIQSMQIYIKTEDFAAYYVINEGCTGKVSLFG